MTKKYSLTLVEHELMQILWHINEGSVNDVIAQLPADRNLAYTSVSTILRILEQKNIVTTRKEKRKHIYIPLISKDEYKQSAVEKLVSNVFSGNPTEVVNYLLDDSQLSVDDISEIKELLNKKVKEFNE